MSDWMAITNEGMLRNTNRIKQVEDNQVSVIKQVQECLNRISKLEKKVEELQKKEISNID